MRRPDSLTTEEAAALEPVACRSAVLARTAALVAGFAQMLLSRHGDRLKIWVTNIELPSTPPHLKSCTVGLRRDDARELPRLRKGQSCAVQHQIRRVRRRVVRS